MAIAFVVAASVAPGARATVDSGQTLVGTFRIAAGACDGAVVSGSRFRMVVPSGNAGGPYASNSNSPCGDQTYTPLAPGSDGGLVTGSYQPAPNPGFDGSGNSLASRITKPTLFYGVAFSTSTNPVDPQTAVQVAAPTISVTNGKLSGDLRAFAASWNRQEFNQGAPKPDGSSPGNTAAPSGTYNAATGAFTLVWASQIQGGPFNNFTGIWHLEGTFAPAQGTSSTTAAPSPTTVSSPASNPGNPARTGPGTMAKPPAGSSATTVSPDDQSAPSAESDPSDPSGTIDTPATPASDGTDDVDSAAGTDAAARASQRSSGGVGPVAAVALLALIAAAAGTWFVRRRHLPSP